METFTNDDLNSIIGNKWAWQIEDTPHTYWLHMMYKKDPTLTIDVPFTNIYNLVDGLESAKPDWEGWLNTLGYEVQDNNKDLGRLVSDCLFKEEKLKSIFADSQVNIDLTCDTYSWLKDRCDNIEEFEYPDEIRTYIKTSWKNPQTGNEVSWVFGGRYDIFEFKRHVEGMIKNEKVTDDLHFLYFKNDSIYYSEEQERRYRNICQYVQEVNKTVDEIVDNGHELIWNKSLYYDKQDYEREL